MPTYRELGYATQTDFDADVAMGWAKPEVAKVRAPVAEVYRRRWLTNPDGSLNFGAVRDKIRFTRRGYGCVWNRHRATIHADVHAAIVDEREYFADDARRTYWIDRISAQKPEATTSPAAFSAAVADALRQPFRMAAE